MPIVREKSLLRAVLPWSAIASLILFPAFADPAASSARGDENAPAPAKWRQSVPPQADADGDGVLTIGEAMAYRKQTKQSKSSAAEGPFASADAPGSRVPDISNARYGSHERNTLDVWLADSASPAPALIYFHGGSFKAGDKSNVLAQAWFDPCLKAGISIVSANYRFSSDARYPAPMLDGARAVQFVRQMAGEWKINPDRLGLSGSSAGGTMALWIALHEEMAQPESFDPVARQSTRVRCVAAHGAPSEIEPREIERLTGAASVGGALAQLFGASSAEELAAPAMQTLAADASPLSHASPGDPPLFVQYQGSLADAPFGPNAPQNLWIHHVCLGMPLKQKYDLLGLEFQMHSKDNLAPDGAEMAFLEKHLLEAPLQPAAQSAFDPLGTMDFPSATKHFNRLP